ncbi:hypothetical protein GH714_010693 [Hevea brasiliensis]|uniref:Uncharacterized protein n=1 Tax=Hevea brasiliensis TaxID=3981 RepID=A0A6A6LI49_HEVBR|nr:hypothetical protein GH714_010693 [Hevea brasiliensis]
MEARDYKMKAVTPHSHVDVLNLAVTSPLHVQLFDFQFIDFLLPHLGFAPAFWVLIDRNFDLFLHFGYLRVDIFHTLHPIRVVLGDRRWGIACGYYLREMLPNSSQVQRVGSKTINVNSSKKFKKPCESEVPEKEELGSKTGSGSTKQNEDDGSRVIELLDDGLCNMEVDNSFVIHTQTKEKGSDVSSKVPHDNYQKMTTSIDGCLHGLTDGATADSLKRQRLTECGDGTGTVGLETENVTISLQIKMDANK